MSTNASPLVGPHVSRQRLSPPVALRVAACAVVGFIGGAIVGHFFFGWRYTPLATWDIAALTFLGWTWLAVHGRSAEATANLAMRESPGHAVSDLLLVFASVMSLAAVGILVFNSRTTSEVIRVLQVGAGIVSVIISWAVVHAVYMLKYAREYYKKVDGIDFNDSLLPSFSDFAYIAFTIGMTFQVSDTNLKSNAMRKIALRHAALSYMFGTVIVAITINLIAGLGK